MLKIDLKAMKKSQKIKKTNSRYRLMKRFILLLIVIIFGMAGCYANQKESVFATKERVSAEKREQDVSGPFERGVSPKTDIHFDAKYCLECHEKLPVSTKEKFLKYGGDFKQLCRCHYESDQFHAHPVNFAPSEKSNVKIPKKFPLPDGKVSCTTCHDIVIQCRDSREDKIFTKGQMFLRGAPHKTRTDICFQCHDRAKYRKYNPHEQIDKNGEVVKQKCFYCHSELPDEKKTTSEDAKLVGDFGALCMGCHHKAAKQVLHMRHLRKPSDEILAHIRSLQTEFNIVLPLDGDGKITCVTCHNPHQKGLIPDTRAGAKGAGEKHRHRLTDNMCMRCHPMR